MSKVVKLALAAAFAATMIYVAPGSDATPASAPTLIKSQTVADAPGGDDWQWCDKGTQGAC